MFVGALYAFGAAVEWRRFARAGISVDDGLPLVPLSHLLSAGIGLVLTTALASAGVGVLLFVLRSVEALVESQRIHHYLQRHRRLLATMKVSIIHQAALATEEADRLLSLKQRVKEFPPVTSAKTDTERQLLLAEGQQLIAEAENLEADKSMVLQRLSVLKRSNKRQLRKVKLQHRAHRLIVPSLKYGPLTIGSVLALFAVPYPIGAALVVAGLIWWVAIKVDVSNQAIRALLFAVVAAGVAFNGIASAPALPIATLRSRTRVIEGAALVVTDTTWYITPGHGVIEKIPTTAVESGSTRPGRSYSYGTLLQIIKSF